MLFRMTSFAAMPHTVLFTRTPEPAHRQFAQSLGLQLHAMPLIKTTLHTDAGALTAALVTDQNAAVAFTSRKAVAFAAQFAEVVEILTTRHVFAVGAKTAEALANTGLHAAYPAVQTASELAMVLGAHAGKVKDVIHPAGNRRRADLEKGLQRQGIGYTPITVYDTATLHPEPDLPEALAAVVFASPSAVQAFFQQGFGELTAAPCYAIGPTTAAAVRAYGRACNMPPRPGFDTLLQLVASEL